MLILLWRHKRAILDHVIADGLSTTDLLVGRRMPHRLTASGSTDAQAALVLANALSLRAAGDSEALLALGRVMPHVFESEGVASSTILLGRQMVVDTLLANGVSSTDAFSIARRFNFTIEADGASISDAAVVLRNGLRLTAQGISDADVEMGRRIAMPMVANASTLAEIEVATQISFVMTADGTTVTTIQSTLPPRTCRITVATMPSVIRTAVVEAV